MIFLDAAATTPVRREVLEAMWPYLTGEFGNPSSHHSLGEAAATALAGARAATAKALGCRPGEIVFTSGGTEADNLAVKGIALARAPPIRAWTGWRSAPSNIPRWRNPPGTSNASMASPST